MSRYLEILVDTTRPIRITLSLYDYDDVAKVQELLHDFQTQIILGNYQAKLVEDITQERIIEP